VETVSLQRPREICGISSNTLWKFGVGEAYETITLKFSDGVYEVSIPKNLGLWWICFIILHTVLLKENVIANFGNVNTSMALENLWFYGDHPRRSHWQFFKEVFPNPISWIIGWVALRAAWHQHCKGVRKFPIFFDGTHKT
jgi:hypothetical protein